MTSFCVYGLGVTGQSVINYFVRERYITDYCVWDDDPAMRSFIGVHINEQKGKRIFSKNIDLADYIIVSPGINLKKAKIKLSRILIFSIFLIQK